MPVFIEVTEFNISKYIQWHLFLYFEKFCVAKMGVLSMCSLLYQELSYFCSGLMGQTLKCFGEKKGDIPRITQFDFILSLCLTSREGEKSKCVV